MAIYTIGDLHLSFGVNKPMDIFGVNWENHHIKIADDWKEKVKEDDLVILPGDFSWAMDLNNTYDDFEYLNSLPGKKLLLKGNHDYWWGTLKKNREFIQNNKFWNIDFIQNNSYLFDNKIIVGTRGWIYDSKAENIKILKREKIRLQMSIDDGINKFGDDKEIIVFMHYPPFGKEDISKEYDIKELLEKYPNIKRCYYGHLHGESCLEGFQGKINDIEYKLVSSDYLGFSLLKIED